MPPDAERAAHARARLRNRPAHALDVHVVLLGPERGRDAVGDVAAGGIAAGDRAVLLRVAPVLQPHRSVRSGKARAVAGREDRRIGRAAVVVHDDAVLRGEARGLRQPIVGRGADPDHDEIGREQCRRFGRRPRAARPADRAAPTRAVPTRMSTPRARWRSCDERGGLLVADARQDARRDLDHGGLDAELGGRCSHLEPDQPAADDEQRLASMQVRLERARLGLGAQVIDAGSPGRKHRQHAVDRAGGEHERVIADALARLGHHRARVAIDRRHPRAALERNAGCGDALRAGDRRVLGQQPCR